MARLKKSENEKKMFPQVGIINGLYSEFLSKRPELGDGWVVKWDLSTALARGVRIMIQQADLGGSDPLKYYQVENVKLQERIEVLAKRLEQAMRTLEVNQIQIEVE